MKNAKWTLHGKSADSIYQRAYDKVSRPNAPPSANAEAYFWEQVALGKSPRVVVQDAVSDAVNWPELAKYAQSLPIDKFKRSGGSMYEVNLRTNPERLLDWDKPLAGQSAGVREALKAVPWGEPYVNSIVLTGGQIAPKTVEGAAQLRKSGIDGIRYLDGGSRAAGTGSSNYVIFDDKLIDLLRRYGLLGMVGGGAAAAGNKNKQAPAEEQTDYAQGGSVDSAPVYDPAVIAAIAASITEDDHA